MAASDTAGEHKLGDHALGGRQHGRLFRKYVMLIVLLVSGALIVSGLVELYFSYRENETALARLQQEKAQGAAATIRDFLGDQERALGWRRGFPTHRSGGTISLDSCVLHQQSPTSASLTPRVWNSFACHA